MFCKHFFFVVVTFSHIHAVLFFFFVGLTFKQTSQRQACWPPCPLPDFFSLSLAPSLSHTSWQRCGTAALVSWDETWSMALCWAASHHRALFSGWARLLKRERPAWIYWPNFPSARLFIPHSRSLSDTRVRPRWSTLCDSLAVPPAFQP